MLKELCFATINNNEFNFRSSTLKMCLVLEPLHKTTSRLDHKTKFTKKPICGAESR